MDTASQSVLVFFVNGKKVEIFHPDPEATLLQYLRRNLKLTGTKLGCGEGGCGACTVMVSHYLPKEDKIHHYSVNACLAPLCSMHGLAITTVEGIGSLHTRLHPVQERIASAHGSQCGFCTPGFVMSMYTLLRNHHRPTPEQLENAFDGNLCRCTGYRSIIDGCMSFIGKGCGLGENCCQNRSYNHPDIIVNSFNEKNESTFSQENCSYDPSQEPIFPPCLKTEGKQLCKQSLCFRSERVTWYRPTSLKELLDIKRQHPDCKFVIGNTEIGIETKFKNQFYPVLVLSNQVQELLVVEHTGKGIRFGSSVTLAILDCELKKAVKDLPEFQTRIFRAFIEILRWFAGHQIRNVAALGGNVMTASPISDLNPLLLACNAVVQVIDTDGDRREVKMDSNFFVSYRKTALKPSEILLSVFIPYSKENEYFYSFKQANRKEDDIAIVNAGMRVVLDQNMTITDCAFAFGGMAPITVMASQTSTRLLGQKWNEELLSLACNLLAADLPLELNAPGGMIQYRRSLTISFFFKFYIKVLQDYQTMNQINVSVNLSDLSAILPLETKLPHGIQVYDAVGPDQSPDDALHRPLIHQSAYKQASGEAIYVDDIPLVNGELFAAFVLSTQAHARLVKVDPSPGLTMKGVIDFISYLDVPGRNFWGAGGEEVFASTEVVHQGQIIGVVVAETEAIARLAATAIEKQVQYEKLDSIITIKDAISKESFFNPKLDVKYGDLEAGFAESEHILEGEVHTEAQEHFYMECNVVVIRPGEDGEMEVYATSQGLTDVQIGISDVLNVPQSKIVVKAKRLGGGFGGKETRNAVITLPLAVAANKLKRPLRCFLDRDKDMMMTGTRHPLLGRYRVGFRSDGKILALNVDLFINAGVSIDMSIGVLSRAVLHSDNCYKIPNMLVTGTMCKTNIPSCTAFRGFGGPQSQVVTETWIAHIASFLRFSPEKVRQINFYKEGDRTFYNQVLENVTIQRCWEECFEKSHFRQRRKEVNLYNSENRWRKRGIAVIPTKFGLAFGKLDMNQGGALVHIYIDGSVLVTHGGVEMGQGLHTKIIQVASRVLGVPASKIIISETATNMVPNTVPTAASMSSDIYGEAVREACQILKDRLEKFRISSGKLDICWEELVRVAYEARISLSSTGFHSVPGIGYDFKTNQGHPYAYFTYGVACSEVEIDCLTGDHKVLSTDIVMDVGKSLNPTIDIGQIEGAFVQGYGMMMLEQYKVQPDGKLLTCGPSTYKIPTLGNIPHVFNVSLLQNSSNPRAIYSSKGIGEPPLFLSASVLHAVQYAIASARQDQGLDPHVILNTPTTPDRIRLACADRFTQPFENASNSTSPWYVDL